MADFPILSVLTWLPVAAGVLLLLLGDGRAAFGRWLALAATLATFALSVGLWRAFDSTLAPMQFVERQPWIASRELGSGELQELIALPARGHGRDVRKGSFRLVVRPRRDDSALQLPARG